MTHNVYASFGVCTSQYAVTHVGDAYLSAGLFLHVDAFIQQGEPHQSKSKRGPETAHRQHIRLSHVEISRSQQSQHQFRC